MPPDPDLEPAVLASVDPAPADLVVRPMLAADLSAVLEIDRSTPQAPHWSLKDYQACVEGSQGGLHRRAWVAETSDSGSASTIRGFVVVCGVAGGEFELESLVVEPVIQGRGVGSTLLAIAIARLRTGSASILRLDVRASNAAAIRLYLAHGFERTGVRKAYYRGADGTGAEDAVLMQLKFAGLTVQPGNRPGKNRVAPRHPEW